MLNPEITWASESMEKDWEGCLSIPGSAPWSTVTLTSKCVMTPWKARKSKPKWKVS